MHHFLGLIRAITETEVVGCRELIKYDEPRTAEEIPDLRFSGNEPCRLLFLRAILPLGLWCLGL